MIEFDKLFMLRTLLDKIHLKKSLLGTISSAIFHFLKQLERLVNANSALKGSVRHSADNLDSPYHFAIQNALLVQK